MPKSDQPLFKLFYICPRCKHVYWLHHNKTVLNYRMPCPCGYVVTFSKELTEAMKTVMLSEIKIEKVGKDAKQFEKSEFDNMENYLDNEKKGPLPDSDGIDWTTFKDL